MIYLYLYQVTLKVIITDYLHCRLKNNSKIKINNSHSPEEQKEKN